MDLNSIETWRTIGIYFASIAGIALVLGVLLLLLAIRQVRKIDIPLDADFTDTLLVTPLLVVVALDLLDLALDFLALPFTWIILNWMGLRALRNVAAAEALIPFTQPIPTLTLCWLAVRFLGVRF